MQRVIEVENISKRYTLGATIKHDSLLESMADACRRIFLSRSQNPSEGKGVREDSSFWALKNVSFEVNRGEVIGIIGKNGAGKSTLLQILSRITEPTEGKAVLRGRVASLLQVGAGFHPELTGRENIFLNGSLLGMKRDEILRKYDEIVEFAEVERFIDTPVKRYSSGMYVRLAFAVAAHLEPEILIVDEVLAVGDAQFQAKCIGKMDDIAVSGRTIIFVSHNMAVVENLCTKCILMDSGTIRSFDETAKVISQYAMSVMRDSEQRVSERTDRQGTGEVIITNVMIVNSHGELSGTVRSGEDLLFRIDYESVNSQVLSNIKVRLVLGTMSGKLINLGNEFTGNDFGILPKHGSIYCRLSKLPLVSGDYLVVAVSIMRGNVMMDRIENAKRVTVLSGDYYGSGIIPSSIAQGPLLCEHLWYSN